MNNILDYKNRQLFLSRTDGEGIAPLLYDTTNERVQLWEQYPHHRVLLYTMKELDLDTGMVNDFLPGFK